MINREVLKIYDFLKKIQPFIYIGLKIVTNITTISIIVGISLYILKNFEDF